MLPSGSLCYQPLNPSVTGVLRVYQSQSREVVTDHRLCDRQVQYIVYTVTRNQPKATVHTDSIRFNLVSYVHIIVGLVL